jgi:vancomycin aglycone glucosyltransferase
VGYVRLSRLASRVAAVVHHGGIGTTYAALAAGTPAVIVPQAFDQGFNAALVEAVGAGVDGRREPLATALEQAVDDAALGARARRVASRLIPPDQATRQLVDRIVTAAGGQAG